MYTREQLNLLKIVGFNAIPPRRLEYFEVIMISELMREVYTECLLREPISAKCGDENAVSNLIRFIMAEKIKHERIYNTMFSNVDEGLNYRFDGTGQQKIPDISITLTDMANYSLPISFEAKIIDNNKKRSMQDYMRDYCKNGVSRFVVGDYSWWSDDGFMVAYVRNNTTIKNLKEYLKIIPRSLYLWNKKQQKKKYAIFCGLLDIQYLNLKKILF